MSEQTRYLPVPPGGNYGPNSQTAKGIGPRIAGDVFIDSDGSFHTARKGIRDLARGTR
jgi:hypothetical protein